MQSVAPQSLGDGLFNIQQNDDGQYLHGTKIHSRQYVTVCKTAKKENYDC